MVYSCLVIVLNLVKSFVMFLEKIEYKKNDVAGEVLVFMSAIVLRE